MLNHITTYLNTRLLTTGYFTRLFEFVELKPQKDQPVAPMMYCNGEWKDVTDFDKGNGTSYIRLRSAIQITEKSNTHVSGETLLNISYPLRVVGVVKNSHLSDNDKFRSVNLAQDISMVITNTGAISLNTVLKSRSVDILATNLNADAVSIMREEMPAVTERYEYTFAAVDINVNIEISQDCYEDACGDAVTNCTVLLSALTKQEKNECILPSYDFSNVEVQESVTAQQEADIIQWLSLIPPYPCDVLNNPTFGLTETQRNQIQLVSSIQTGQLVSFQTGDDGDLQEGRLVDFYTLKCNNPFGNTDRFTDFFGGQTYANGLCLDWASGLMIKATLASGNWTTAIAAAVAATDGGFTDWALPNRTHLYLLSDADRNSQLNYPPFNFTGATIWSSTTPRLSSANAYALINNISVASNGNIQQTPKINVNSYLYCRTFLLSDVGL